MLPAKQLRALVGAHFIPPNASDFTEHKIKAFHNHPRYDDGHEDYDLTLYELKKPIVIRLNAKAIHLPDPTDSVLTIRKFVVSGWGEMKLKTMSNALMAAKVNYVAMPKCVEAWGSKVNPRIHICAGGKKDACVGDSGGKNYGIHYD